MSVVLVFTLIITFGMSLIYVSCSCVSYKVPSNYCLSKLSFLLLAMLLLMFCVTVILGCQWEFISL